MPPYALRTHYFDDLPARNAFKRFLHTIHGLDLSLWESRGLWNPDYIPFSLFNSQNQIVSSACLYSTDMLLNGQRTRVAQLSGVGTLPLLRRKNLARQCVTALLNFASTTHTGAFLFSDMNATPFYHRLHFTPWTESFPSIPVPTTRPAPRPLKKLNPSSNTDLALLLSLATIRTPVSHTAGAFNPELTAFHFLYSSRDHTYHCPDLNAILICSRNNTTLTLHDLIAPEIPPLPHLLPHLATLGPFTDLHFRFEPDRLRLDPAHISRHPTTADNPHHFPPFPLPHSSVVIPSTARA